MINIDHSDYESEMARLTENGKNSPWTEIEPLSYRAADQADTARKKWKLTEEAWRNCEKWELYLEASGDVINRTDTDYAPWHIIPGNNKKYARITALETIIKTCETKLKGL